MNTFTAPGGLAILRHGEYAKVYVKNMLNLLIFYYKVQFTY